MTTITTAWGDGTADVIYITYMGGVGSTVMTIVADRNKTIEQRRRVIQLKATTGVVLATLIVTQKSRSRAFVVSYNKSYK